MNNNGIDEKDKIIIQFFEKQIAKRNNMQNKELWLADLNDIYEALMPYLPVSGPAKTYIHKIIMDAQ